MKYRLQVAGHEQITVEEARPIRNSNRKQWIEVARYKTEQEARVAYPTAKWRDSHTFRETHTL